MKQLQKWGGVAALYAGIAYIIGFVGFLGVIDVGSIADPVERLAAMAANQNFLVILYLIVYVFWGAMMVVLSLALAARLRGKSPALAQTTAAFGLFWAGLVMASGMIYNVGMGAVIGIAQSDPAQAGTVWLAIESVFNGLGGGVEVVGGIWMLVLSWAALKGGELPRLLNFLGMIVGVAGVITVVPALGEIGGIVFGLTQIVWFLWTGVAMLRSQTMSKTVGSARPAMA